MRTGWLAVGIVVLLGVVYGRALVESRRELSAGESLLATEARAAHTHLRHAVEWYAPLNTFSQRAADRLLESGLAFGQVPERRDDALNALESLRSGILVTRGLYTPYPDHIRQAEAEIARLRALDVTAQEPERHANETARQLELLQQSRARAPAPGWSLVTTSAFIIWIGLTARLIYPASGSGPRKKRRLWVNRSGWLVSLTMWLVGLTLV